MTAVSTSLSLSNDLLTGIEWSPAQLRDFFHLAAEIKATPDRYRTALAGHSLALIFEKPSLRTRVTFEVGVASLGGTAVFLDHTLTHLGERESVRDIAKNLERWVHGIVARVFAQESLEEFAAEREHSGDQRAFGQIPPLPGACRFLHTRGTFRQSARVQIRLRRRRQQHVPFAAHHWRARRSACSRGHARGIRARSRQSSRTRSASHARPAAKSNILRSPQDAVAGAQAVYTDVWASMGQEDETAERENAFAAYQVNEALFAQAAPDAVFMHCLPAHRGLEVSAGVIDSPRSIVYDQAENRLHVQKAVLHTLFT